MSVPEPPPLDKGENVPDALISFIESLKHDSSVLSSAITLVRERDEFGRKKYGQPLKTQDGRNSIEDARQELGDLLQYTFKARLNGEDLSPIRELLPVLNSLLKDIEEK